MTSAPELPDGTVRMTHYGAANWRFTDGRTTVWLDPYFTRLRSERHPGFGPLPEATFEGDDRPVHAVGDPVVSDHALVDTHVDAADYILISHSHLNHCMDAPGIALRTGATVIGSASTANVARAHGVPEDQIITVRGGEDFAFDERFSLRVVPSLHSPLNAKHFFEAGTIPDGLVAPLKVQDYVEGGTFAYLLRLGGREILAFGSMNYNENDLREITPDSVLVAAAPARKHIHDYTSRLLRTLGHPPLVVATHWDRQALPYGVAQTTARAEAEEFLAEARAASPKARVLVPEHFESIELTA
jgi:L-ascorbate metabolism protein UlaG (beta-lactamase superfamily)